MSATYPVPDNHTNTLFGIYPRPYPPAADVAVQEPCRVKQQLKSNRVRRKEMHPPQRACSENYTGQMDTMPIGTYHKTKPIIDYATPIVIEPHTEREHGRMDLLFHKGQHNMCSQYTDFHCTYNSPSPSPPPRRDSAMDDGCQDNGVNDGVTPPPGNLDRTEHSQPGEPPEKCVIKREENPTIGTVNMVEAKPIVIEPVVDDMVQMKQAYAGAHTTPSRNPSHLTALLQTYPNGYRYNSCYQTPPPHHYWPGSMTYVGYGGHYTALGILTPYHPVNFNHIPPVNHNRYPLLSQKLVNSSPWRDVAHRQTRPGHPYFSTPPRAPHTLTLQPLLIKPVPMNLPNVACQNPPQASYKPGDDDDRAVMMRTYAKKERQVSVNISGTCYLHEHDIARMQRECMTLGWCTQYLEMSAENQIVEFDVEERKPNASAITSGPPSEQEISDYHYRLLEKRLPRHLKVHIDALADKASKHEGGNFFDNAINKDLLYIEQACGKLSAFNHKLVYEHLAQHLPCSKETLRRHAETLALAVVRRKLQNLMDSLFHRLEKEMPYQIERHLWECSVATKLQFQQQAMTVQSPTRGRPDLMAHNHQLKSSSTSADQHHMPAQSFLWTEVTRQLIWDILKTKLATYPSKKSNKDKIANFKGLQEFVQRQVVSAWPEGWMDTETIFTESRKVQQQLRGTSDLLDH